MRYSTMFLAVLAVSIGCGDSKNGSASKADYDMVSVILGGPEQPATDIGKCAASSCHGGMGNGHGLMNFKTAKDLNSVLVNVPACENSSLMRVKPGDPDHSWLWIKLTADVMDTTNGLIKYTGTPSSCTGVGTSFGTRMPQNFGGFPKLSDADLATIKAWIEGGAPGPNG